MFGLAFFILNIVLVLQVIPVGQGFLSDRFTYIASIGIFVMLGWLVHDVSRRKQSLSTVLVGGTVLYVLVLAGMTYQRTKVWENSLTLWNDVISKNDTHFLAFTNRGQFLLEAGDPQAALNDFNASIQLDNSKAQTWYNRGVALGSIGQHAEAIIDFDQALRLEPDYVDAFANRGLMKASLLRDEEAILDFDQALSIDPDHINALANRGTASYNLKRFEEAIPFLDKAIALNPNEALALYIRGMSKLELGQRDAGCYDLHASNRLGFEPARQAVQRQCQ